MRRIAVGLIVLVALLALGWSGNATAAAGSCSTLTSKDTFVNQAAPTTKSGTSGDLKIRNATKQTRQTYLGFTVSCIPDGATVTGANLRLTPRLSSTLGVRASLANSNTWTESGLYWNNRPGFGPAASAVDSLHPAGETENFALTLLPSGNGSYSYVMEAPTVGGTAVVTYYSRQAQVVSGLKPTLVLDWTVPEPTTTTTPETTTTVEPTTTTVGPPAYLTVEAAGDIAGAQGAFATSDILLADNPTAVLTLGDNAYPNGTEAEFLTKYDPSWGRVKDKTWPSPGNHDHFTAGAAGYYSYFGDRAPGPYYSFDIGEWHFISLNSEIDRAVGSPQHTWLLEDLATHPNRCTLAYWHKPRFSSGSKHGGDPSQGPFWDALYSAGADIVENGHEHHYERFAKQNPVGLADPEGLRQFVVGTGGVSHYGFGTPIANSEVRVTGSFGVLKLTLHPDSYDWEFRAATGTGSDAGSDVCH